MKTENVRLWLKDLRSGLFTQTKGALRRDATLEDEGYRQGHCCLGVAACTYQEATGEGYWLDGGFCDGSNVSVHKGTLENCDRAQRWLGLTPGIEGRLVELNDDDEYGFDEIALFIERVLLEGKTEEEAEEDLAGGAQRLRELDEQLKAPAASEPQVAEEEVMVR